MLLRIQAIALTLALATSSLVLADALDGVLEVRSAYVNIDKGVFLLHARVEYPDTAAVRDALRDGITLIFDLNVRVDRERHRLGACDRTIPCRRRAGIWCLSA